jgi:hypothetical protein
MRMITACFARALHRGTSRICMHFLFTFQEVILISKTRNQLQGIPCEHRSVRRVPVAMATEASAAR